MSKMKKFVRIIPLLAVLIAVLLMVLPTSAYLTVAKTSADVGAVFKAYFSIDFFVYAKYTPPITAYSSALLAVLHCIGLLIKKMRRVILAVSYECAILSVYSLFSFLLFPILPICIALLLVGSAILYTITQHSD